MSTPSRQASFILIVLFALCAWTYAQQPAPVPVSTPVPVALQMIQPSQAVSLVNEWGIALTTTGTILTALIVFFISKIGEIRAAVAAQSTRLDSHSIKINDIALATQPTMTNTAVNPPENTH